MHTLQSATGAECEAAGGGMPESVVRITERLLPWAGLWAWRSRGAGARTRLRDLGDGPTWFDGDALRVDAFAGVGYGLVGPADTAATPPSLSGSFSGGGRRWGPAGADGGSGGGRRPSGLAAVSRSGGAPLSVPVGAPPARVSGR